MIRKIVFFLSLSIGISMSISAQIQNLNLDQLSYINVDQLSNEQIQAFWDKVQAQGYSITTRKIILQPTRITLQNKKSLAVQVKNTKEIPWRLQRKAVSLDMIFSKILRFPSLLRSMCLLLRATSSTQEMNSW